MYQLKKTSETSLNLSPGEAPGLAGGPPLARSRLLMVACLRLLSPLSLTSSAGLSCPVMFRETSQKRFHCASSSSQLFEMKYCLNFTCPKRRQCLSAPLLCNTHEPRSVVMLIGFCSVSVLCKSHTQIHTSILTVNNKQPFSDLPGSPDFGALVGSFWAF